MFISADKQLFFAIYIDNLFLFGANKSQINIFTKELSHRFQITNLRNISYYLRIKIYCDHKKGIIIFLQTTYLKILLKRFGIAEYNLSTIFIVNGFLNPIIPSFLNYQAFFETIFWYSSAISFLIYIITMI